MAATEANGVFHPKDRVYIYSRDDSGRRTHPCEVNSIGRLAQKTQLRKLVYLRRAIARCATAQTIDLVMRSEETMLTRIVIF